MALFKTIKDSFVNGWNKNKEINESNSSSNSQTSIPLELSSHTFIPDRLPDGIVNFNSSINKQNKRELLNPYYLDTTFTKNRKISQSTNISTSFSNIRKYENPFKLSGEVISLSNKYKFIYDNTVDVLLQNGLVDFEGDEKPKKGAPTRAALLELGAVPSLFNPMYGIYVLGMSENLPLLNLKDSNISASTNGLDEKNQVTFMIGDNVEDTSDCSIKKLVELSVPAPGQEFPALGRSTYKYADFMYCKDLGKIANNHLITLRRFAYPVGDDIWTNYTEKNTPEGVSDSIPFDVGRLVCYFGDDNKIEDILKYKYIDSWRPLNAEIEQKDSTSDSDDRGILGSIVNLGNSNYRNFQATGHGEGGNKILNWVSGNIKLPIVGKVFNDKGQYSSGEGRTLLGNYDKHKVYEKQGTVQDTHIYEGKLQFSQEFTLIFDYELRAYENINPKSAFLDLLGNILAVTYKKGDFWGGEQKLIGTPENMQGWKIADGIIDNTLDKVGSFASSFLRGDVSTQDILGTFSNLYEGIKGKIGEWGEEAGKIVNGDFSGFKELGEEIADAADKYDVGAIMKGMLKNRLGRPSVYAFNSLLSGSPVGLWHVTLGNPRNPIMAMGNLIITESIVQHYGPLGIDDFPTGIKVAVTLKHAKSRDAVEISKMYTKGTNSIYLNFVNSNGFDDYFELTNNNVFGIGKNGQKSLERAIASTKAG